MNEGAPRLNMLSLSQESRRIHEGGSKVKHKKAIFCWRLGNQAFMPIVEVFGVIGGTFSRSRRGPHDSGGSNAGGNCGACRQRPIPRGDARPLSHLARPET